MSFSSFLEKALGAVVETASKMEAETVKKSSEYARKCAERQEKIDRYEAQHGVTEKSKQARAELNNAYERLGRFNGRTDSADSSDGQKIGGKTVEEWDHCWLPIGPLESADLKAYNHCVGLYRHKVRGKVMYIGRAIELNNGGFRKRLSDYRRDSDSARTHKSGQIIYDNLDKIHTDIMIVGYDKDAVEITRKLEMIFINKYDPEWNVCHN